jgi:hypothetical protein
LGRFAQAPGDTTNHTPAMIAQGFFNVIFSQR